MRGIDYLTSRKDIDGSKIGCTGCSGGGTLTSYIMALDERVGFAAPACYLTTFRQLIGTIGPQDSEQNIFGQIAYGMDHTDYVLMRAPRPTLICCSSGDYFDVQGTWDNFRQSKKYYSLLGNPLAIDLVEDKGKHGITKLQRETLTRLARRWFLGDDNAVKEKPMKTTSGRGPVVHPKRRGPTPCGGKDGVRPKSGPRKKHVFCSEKKIPRTFTGKMPAR